MTPFQKGLAGAIVVAFLSAGCGGDNTSAPTLSNPTVVSQEVSNVNATFTGSAFRGLGAVGGSIKGVLPSPPALARVRAMVAATMPRAPVVPMDRKDRFAARAKYAQTLRGLLPTLTGAGQIQAQAAVIPQQFLGKTYEWDPNSHSYVDKGTLGAPADGIRFIIYQVTASDSVDEANLTEVAKLDIVDSVPAGLTAAKIGITLFEGAVTYAAYSVGANYSVAQQTFDAASTGYISSGTARLDFAASVSVTQSSVTFDVTRFDYDKNLDGVADVKITQHEGIAACPTVPPSPAVCGIITLRFTFQGSGQAIAASGTVTVNNDGLGNPNSVTVTIDFTITVSGRTYATITGDITVPVVKDANGQVIDNSRPDDLHAVVAILDSPGDVGTELEGFLSPGLDLLPGGDSVDFGF